MGWRVVDAGHALRHAVAMGADEYTGPCKVMDVPAIGCIGGSLICFIHRYFDECPCKAEFDWIVPANPLGVGFHFLDHLTHNGFKGNMDVRFRFYGDLFDFREIRFFDIVGKITGIYSRALTSPRDKFRFPINEDRGETGPIINYLYK